MRKIDVSFPMSVARVLTPKLQMFAPDAEIVVRRIQQKEQDPLSLEGVDIPDLTVTHQISIMKNRDIMALSGHYGTLKGLLPEVRSDLKERGFDEPTGYFKPMCFVPIVIIYNRFVNTPPTSWEDLLNQQWKGRIGASSPDILRKLITAYAISLFGERAEQLISNVIFDGLPIDVNLKIDDGRLDIGIVPLPFSRSSRNRNVVIQWPREGAFCLPQVLIHKKDAVEDALRVSEYLLSDDVQRYISDVGIMIPVNSNVPLPHEVEENKLNLFWKGWDWFISGINAV